MLGPAEILTWIEANVKVTSLSRVGWGGRAA